MFGLKPFGGGPVVDFGLILTMRFGERDEVAGTLLYLKLDMLEWQFCRGWLAGGFGYVDEAIVRGDKPSRRIQSIGRSSWRKRKRRGRGVRVCGSLIDGAKWYVRKLTQGAWLEIQWTSFFLFGKVFLVDPLVSCEVCLNQV